MNSINLAHNRLGNQHIAGTKFKTVKDIIGWMGAIQAQDYNMAKWAVGLRLPGSTEKMIEQAIDKGEIIRTHLLRPTWHLVSADDVRWMLELTAPGIKTSMISRNKQLGLTDSVFEKSNNIIEKALSGDKNLTRDEIRDELTVEGMVIDGPLLSHILMQAELDGIICSGPMRGKKLTYALLGERVPEMEPISRTEALERLACRYFTSHGPATLQDFVWCSGLSVTDARTALGLAEPELVSEKIDSQTYWFSDTGQRTANDEKSVHLLPAFDELIIGYKDRNALLPPEEHRKVISRNGMFWPTILVNGRVAGMWKRTVKKDRIIIETDFFQAQDGDTKELLKEASVNYGDFLERKIEMMDE